MKPEDRSNIRIRRARVGEAAALTEIAHLAKRSWDYPEEWIRLWRRDLTISEKYIENNDVFVAESEQSVVGVGALEPVAKGCELTHLWIHPDHMRRGIGRRLFDHAVQEARRRDATHLTIVSDPHAVRFYKRMGARKVGKVDSRPKGRRIPKLILDLSPGKENP